MHTQRRSLLPDWVEGGKKGGLDKELICSLNMPDVREGHKHPPNCSLAGFCSVADLVAGLQIQCMVVFDEMVHSIAPVRNQGHIFEVHRDPDKKAQSALWSVACHCQWAAAAAAGTRRAGRQWGRGSGGGFGKRWQLLEQYKINRRHRCRPCAAAAASVGSAAGRAVS